MYRYIVLIILYNYIIKQINPTDHIVKKLNILMIKILFYVFKAIYVYF